jgi:DNA repair protein RadC
MRQCCKCLFFKNEDEFKLYSYNRCYACIREQNRLFIQKNKEIVSERKKKYRELRKTNLRTFLTFLHSIMRQRVANKNKMHPSYEGIPICSKEDFIVCSLTIRNTVIAVDVVSIGTLSASLVHPRELFGQAIKRHAAQIIISHNHPSGETDPSEDDLKITKRIVEAGKIMGIEVLDHLIVTTNSYLSFKEKYLI